MKVRFVIPSYNQEKYIAAAVRSALSQTYQPLQIVVSDDCSSDATFDIIQQTVHGYRGPHRLVVRRNATNRGLDHFNMLFSGTDSEVIVLAHGDDIAFPERTAKIVEAFLRYGASMVSSNCLVIDQADKLFGAYQPIDQDVEVTPARLAQGWCPLTVGSTLAWKREVFDVFGPLDKSRVAFGLDYVLPFRAALLAGVRYLSQPLLLRRHHPESAAAQLLYNTSGSTLEFRESALANDLTNACYMLLTLQRAREQLDAAAPVDQVRSLLFKRIIGKVEAWAKCRNELRLQGRRNYWLTEAPPGYERAVMRGHQVAVAASDLPETLTAKARALTSV
jgi:cellulose synthase/poly-beta-1,6-N-acetylglucosamine synthase-like glycosyltransferase